MKQYRLISWATLIVAVFILILPIIIPICTGVMMTQEGAMLHMRCYYTYQAEFLVSLLTVIVAGSLLVVKSSEARLLAAVILVLLSIIIVVLPQPWAIGICKHAASACQKTTNWLTIGGTLLTILGIGSGYLSWSPAKSDS